MEQSAGKTFVAAERGHTETDGYRSYQTFSSGAYQEADKAPFGGLYVLNDETLAGGRHFTAMVEEDTLVLLIPAVGALVYTDSLGHENLLEAGQVQSAILPKGTAFLAGNAFDDERTNFIQCRFRFPASSASEPIVTGIDLQHRHQLAEITTGTDTHRAFLGKFAEGEEAVYHLETPGNGLFVFVLEGAFKVQHRPLDTRDALALWNITEVHLQARSNHAILLLLEMPVDLSRLP